MRQRGHQKENRESNTDIEKQLGPQQGDGADSGGNMTNLHPTWGLIFKYWHVIFVVSGAIAVLFVDPLFFYVIIIKEDDKCLVLDRKLQILTICLRLLFDMIYFANMILGFLCPYIYHEDAIRDLSGRTELAKRYFRSYFPIVDILAILPIPQVLVPIIFKKLGSSQFVYIKLLNAFIFLHYVPRVLRIYLSWRKHIEVSRKLARRLWPIKAAFNFFLYIFASNVCGAFWYYFSIQRQMDCWRMACEKHSGCTSSTAFHCYRHIKRETRNYSFLDDDCLIQTQNTTLFNFGIFHDAIHSGIVASTDIPQKIMYSFWWGLRNFSSFGQSLQTSSSFWENSFTVSISILGLLLFVYLIGHVQTYIQMATEISEVEAEKSKMEAKKSEEIKRNMKPIEYWIARNQLPFDMAKQISSYIQHRMEENKDFDIEKPILHFPKDLITEIKHHLCLSLLKKVQILQNEDESLLSMICESLKPLYYNEDSYILREGEPLNAMLFITQGSVWCFKTLCGDIYEGIVSGAQCIEKGEFYGEELLKWGFNGSPTPKLLDLPISKTVKTVTKVEAFALTANDWKNIIVSKHSQAASTAKGFAQSSSPAPSS